MRTADINAPISEAAFQLQVTGLAELLGWHWAHFRAAQTSRGWRTPVSGPMGAGFPDLVMARPRDGRLIFAELKRDGAKADPRQQGVLDVLGTTAAEVYTWRPAVIEAIAEVLR